MPKALRKSSNSKTAAGQTGKRKRSPARAAATTNGRAKKAAPKASPKAGAKAAPKNGAKNGLKNGSKAAPKPAPAKSGPALKARFAEVASTTSRINGMKNSISKNFFEVGLLLNKIRLDRLYEVKGYGSFESFVEREINVNKIVCMRSARIAEAMQRDVALEAGLERSSAAVAALDGEVPVDAMIARPNGKLGSGLPAHKR